VVVEYHEYNYHEYRMVINLYVCNQVAFQYRSLSRQLVFLFDAVFAG